MKIRDLNASSESNSALETISFSIGDEGIIMDFLRSKLYSDPIGSICREITCNARDAHREAGIPERPILITLPTTFESILRIRDYGMGINPDRMNNVYSQYGTSTKRESNEQVGAFGIGAKSPFAYTPQFTITSITKIESKNDCDFYRKATETNISDKEILNLNMKCIYVAFNTSDRKGGINLLSCSLTEEETGVEVLVDIKKNDKGLYINNIRKWTQYWDVKPKFKNVSITYEEKKPIVSGSIWKIYNKNNNYFSYYETDLQKVIIDGIPYPLNISHFEDYKKLSKLNFDIFINTGDVNLSISRENLYYDSYTLKQLKDKLNIMIAEMEISLQTDIDNAKSYKEAYDILSEFNRSVYRTTNNFLWNDSIIYITHPDFSKIKNEYRIYTYIYSDYKNKIVRSALKSLNFSHTILINDEDKFIRKASIDNYIKTKNIKNESVYVISSPENKIFDLIKEIEEEFKINFDDLNVEKLSTYKAQITKQKIKKNKNEIFAFTYTGSRWEKKLVNLSSIDGYYLIHNGNDGNFFIDKDSQTLCSAYSVNRFIYDNNLGDKVIRISKSQLKKVEQYFKPFKELLLQEKEKIENTSSLEDIIFNFNYLNQIKSKYGLLLSKESFLSFGKCKDIILDIKSEINKLESNLLDIDNIKEIYTLLHLNEDYFNTELKINEKIKSIFDKDNKFLYLKNRYPMLFYILDNCSYHSYNEDYSEKNIKKNIKEYIDMVDLVEEFNLNNKKAS